MSCCSSPPPDPGTTRPWPASLTGAREYSRIAILNVLILTKEGRVRFTEKAQAEIAEVLKENTGKVLRVLFKGYG